METGSDYQQAPTSLRVEEGWLARLEGSPTSSKRYAVSDCKLPTPATPSRPGARATLPGGAIGGTAGSPPYQSLDLDDLMDAAWVALTDLSRVAETGSLEELKEFVRGFLVGLKIDPDHQKRVPFSERLPRAVMSGAPDSSVGMVPGGRSEALQMIRVSSQVVILQPFRPVRRAA